MNKNTFYVTTPIYYVNGHPHIGHAYTTIAADTISRYKTLMNYDVFFATGADEHGQKIFKAAAEKNLPTQEFIDNIVIKFKDLWKILDLNYSDFIRTTEERHKKAVIHILNTLHENGDIYDGKYEGWYCIPCESFFPETQLIEGKCPDCGREVEWLEEISHFFKLSKYQDWLISYIKENNLIEPKTKQNEILSFLKNDLTDLCISRPKHRLEWGISLPFDKDHVTYVWFDALINYLSILGYPDNKELFNKFWPCDFHLIGKDILRPHAVFWPIMLKAMGLPIPKKIFAHGWWVIEGEKISKSKGNVINPETVINEFGLDSFRYFLLREVPFGTDGSFSREKIINRINNELANDLGNLVSRCAGMLNKYCEGIVPCYNKNHSDKFCNDLNQSGKETFEKIDVSLNNLKFSEALDSIWHYLNRLNRYVEESAPWTLNKTPEKRQELENCMYNLLNGINYVSILIYPFMPLCSEKIRKCLNLEKNINKNSDESIEDYLDRIKINTNIKIGKVEPLFPKIEKGV